MKIETLVVSENHCYKEKTDLTTCELLQLGSMLCMSRVDRLE